MKCPECQSDHINKNGHRGQKQNYISVVYPISLNENYTSNLSPPLSPP